MTSSVHVRVENVDKSFGAVRALRDVTVEVQRGTVHGLVGENGAGKSTLGKLIAGLLLPDKGRLIVDGRGVCYRSPRDARTDGIAVITQEITLIPRRSVIDNVFVGIEPAKRGFIQEKELARRYDEVIHQAGFAIPGRAEAGSLPLAKQQQVEVMRAIARNAKLIVMDEPTTALDQKDAESFITMVHKLRRRGITIIFVSHFLRTVLEIADSTTVMRDGTVVRTAPASGESEQTLITAMLGRPIAQLFPARSPSPPGAEVVLSARGLSRGTAVLDTDLEIRRGEIVGLAGPMGSGRTELVRLLFGADRPDSGQIFVGPDLVTLRSPKDAIRLGIAMVPENRKEAGLHLNRPILENITMAHFSEAARVGVIGRAAERRLAGRTFRQFDVRAASLTVPVGNLSGGNQQRVLFAKWLFKTPRVLIADEPTRGVDIGAKQAIYELLVSLAASGVAIVMVSSEIAEIVHLSHRILIMRHGRIVAELAGRHATEDQVMAAAFGSSVNNPGGRHGS